MIPGAPMKHSPTHSQSKRRAPRHAMLALAGALVTSALGCDSHSEIPMAPLPTPTPPPTAGDTLRIGFVGNSLTYVNDLPGMLTALSRAAGDSPTIETESVAFPDYALEDHLAQGDALKMIRRGGWDVIALQQGPSTLPASRENLIFYSRIFADSIRAHGAEPAMYGVWPEQARLYAFDDGIASYAAAADSIHGLLFPAALVWKTAWEIDATLPLYGPDAFHPSELGTYAAAVTIYAVARHRSPVGLPFRLDVGGVAVSLDSLQALTVQQAAASVTSATSEVTLRR